MHNGRIAYFEDNMVLVNYFRRSISLNSNERHQVVAEAVNLSGSLAVLDQIHNGEVDANIVLSDGNLSSVGGSDVKKIMERVAELGLNVRTVLLSQESAEYIGVKVDAQLLKQNAYGDRLIQLLDALPEIE